MKSARPDAPPTQLTPDEGADAYYQHRQRLGETVCKHYDRCKSSAVREAIAKAAFGRARDVVETIDDPALLSQRERDYWEKMKLIAELPANVTLSQCETLAFFATGRPDLRRAELVDAMRAGHTRFDPKASEACVEQADKGISGCGDDDNPAGFFRDLHELGKRCDVLDGDLP